MTALIQSLETPIITQRLQEYRSREAFHFSGGKQLIRSPRHYLAERKRWGMEMPGSALRVGIALHKMMFQPDSSNIILYDRTKGLDTVEFRKFLAAGQHDPQDIVTPKELENVQYMYDSLQSIKEVMSRLNDCDKEVTIYGQAETAYGPVDEKACLDAVSDTDIYDLKTTSEFADEWPHSYKFRNKYRYPMQGGFYKYMSYNHMPGVRIRNFWWIVVESFEPYGVKLYKARAETLAGGYNQAVDARELYAKCLYQEDWPCYDASIIEEV